MQRVNKKDHFIARLKHPPKEDWRAKAHKHQKPVEMPEPYVPPHTPFLQERAPITTLGMPSLFMFGVFATVVRTATQQAPNYSTTHVPNQGPMPSTK